VTYLNGEQAVLLVNNLCVILVTAYPVGEQAVLLVNDLCVILGMAYLNGEQAVFEKGVIIER
jgi:hypothetical protein